MTKKNNETTNVYERITKQELFAFMNSPTATETERERLYMAFKRNVDLFKTIRHGKTLVVGSEAAKKYIKEEKEGSRALSIAFFIFAFICTVLMFLFADLIGQNMGGNVMDNIALAVTFCLDIFIGYYLVQFLLELNTLNVSEEHVNRSSNPDYFSIDFEIQENLAQSLA